MTSDDDYAFEGAAPQPARDNNPPLSISELSFALKRTLEERFGHVRLRGDLGDVQRVDLDASGAVTGLIIEPAGEGGPRWVRIPLDGLTPRKEGDDYDLVSTMTLEQLKAMPAWMP